MSKIKPTRRINPLRSLQKFAVSAFVVLTFIAYAVHEHIVNPNGTFSAVSPVTSAAAANQLPDSPRATPAQPVGAPAAPGDASASPANPTAAPPPTATPQPAPTAKSQGAYRDGTYTGPQVDAYWGVVEVQAVIQNGRIAQVQFLEYPNDRRTSVRINSIVIPYLQSEAIQAQSANVDAITGATLTSEAFMQSLQAALSQAKAIS